MRHRSRPSSPSASANSGYWDSVAGQWAGRTQRLWRIYCDRLNAGVLARWLPSQPVARILKTDVFDEAVSRGLYPLLSSASRQVIGIDISLGMLTQATSQYPMLRAVAADVRSLPFADATFDCVISNSTLDHFSDIDDLAAGLRELNRVLKPGGQLLLTLDNLANPVVAIRNALPWRLLNRMGLVPYFVGATCGPAGLRRLLADTGLTTAEMRSMMHCPRILAVALAAALDLAPIRVLRLAYVRALLALEKLDRLPTRYLSGYFIAARAVKPQDS